LLFKIISFALVISLGVGDITDPHPTRQCPKKAFELRDLLGGIFPVIGPQYLNF